MNDDTSRTIDVADVELWAIGADIFELARAGLAIKLRIQAIKGELGEKSGPFVLAADRLEAGELERLRNAPAGRFMPLQQPATSLEAAKAFVQSADVAELEQLALAIKARVAGVADELEGAKFQ